jgi:hypothetical protein
MDRQTAPAGINLRDESRRFTRRARGGQPAGFTNIDNQGIEGLRKALMLS